MPFTLITLKKTLISLRGDLTKWMQEIAPGVYVGNFNSKIRQEIWKRVIDSSGIGEATLSFTERNEIGYNFETFNTNQKVIDFEGIPLVMYPKKESIKESQTSQRFSNASKFHKARKYSKKTAKKAIRQMVFLDIETDGLNEKTNNILEIGAVKESESLEEFNCLIKVDRVLPKEIVELTGITEEELEKGENLIDVLKQLIEFIGEREIVGYGIKFDIKFINHNLVKSGLEKLTNKSWDLMEFVKKEKIFLDNYKLETVLKEYDFDTKVPHRALKDAKIIYDLSKKVQKFQDFVKLE